MRAPTRTCVRALVALQCSTHPQIARVQVVAPSRIGQVFRSSMRDASPDSVFLDKVDDYIYRRFPTYEEDDDVTLPPKSKLALMVQKVTIIADERRGANGTTIAADDQGSSSSLSSPPSEETGFATAEQTRTQQQPAPPLVVQARLRHNRHPAAVTAPTQQKDPATDFATNPEGAPFFVDEGTDAVSYTHLTLPTIYSV